MLSIIVFSVALLAILGGIFGVGLAVAAKRFHVEMDPRVERVLASLPGANCGACGYPGCEGCAIAIVKGNAPANACNPGGEKAARLIAAIMSVEVGHHEPRRAVVHCKGGRLSARDEFGYVGLSDCAAAALLHGGPKKCKFGCLGFGNCKRACPFGAIAMGADGLPLIFEEKCTACGLCVKACPVGIMSVLESKHRVFVGCSNPVAKGKEMKDACSHGCIKCRLCVKVTQSGAVAWGDSNLPELDFERWSDPDPAVERCPAQTFSDQRGVAVPFTESALPEHAKSHSALPQ